MLLYKFTDIAIFCWERLEQNHSDWWRLTRDIHLTMALMQGQHKKVYVDKCITGVSGIDPDAGCYTAIPSEASMKRTLVAHSRECILLVDSSKFNRKAFCLAFALSDVNTIVTDSDTPKEIIDKLKSKNIKVYVV